MAGKRTALACVDGRRVVKTPKVRWSPRSVAGWLAFAVGPNFRTRSSFLPWGLRALLRCPDVLLSFFETDGSFKSYELTGTFL